MSNAKHERIQKRLTGLETRETDSRLVKDTINLIKQYTHRRLQTVTGYQDEPEGTTKSKYYHDRCDILLKLFTEIDVARRNECDVKLAKALKLCNERYLSYDFPYLRLRASSTLYYAINVLREKMKSNTFKLKKGNNQFGQTSAELTRTCEQLTQRNELLSRENASLRRENSQLREEVRVLKGEITDLKADTTDLKAQVRDLTESKARSEENFLKLKADVQLLMQDRASPSRHVGPSYESLTSSSETCDLNSGSNSQSSGSPDTHFVEATTTGISIGCGSSS